MADREQQRRAQAERRKYARYRSYIRMGAILLALILSIIALAQSCSAKRTANTAQQQVQEAAAAASQQAALAGQESAAAEAEPVVSQNVQQTVTLDFVGDVTLNTVSSADTTYDGSMTQYYDQYGASYFLQNVSSTLSSADLTVANLECAITETDEAADKSSVYKADPSYTSILTEGGIGAACVANDHTHDYSDAGYTDTLANLDNAGILRFGADYTSLDEISGVQVGLVGVYEGDTSADATTLLQNGISSLASQGAQIIVACLHWSTYDSGPSDAEITMAHAAIDAGATVVVCSHPDPLGGIESYNGRYIFYSLGQFLYGGSYAVDDMDTMILSVSFSVNGDTVNTSYTVIPCLSSSQGSVNNYCPTPVTGDNGAAIISKINTASASLSGGVTTADDGTVTSSASPADVSPDVSAGTETETDTTETAAASGTAETSTSPNIAAPAA